jgi:alpha-tubulin suppressor-like RCC1 family protein
MDDALGLGDGTHQLSPARVGSASDWDWLDVYGYGNVGVRSGELWRWGHQTFLAEPTRSAPMEATFSHAFERVVLQSSHECGIVVGRLYCRGENSSGELGHGEWGEVSDGPAHESRSWVRVGDQNDWFDVAVGWDWSCGLRGTGKLYCWGSGVIAGGHASGVPVRIGTYGDWTRIASGHRHVCAIRDDKLFCWGANDSCQLGLGDYHIATPLRVAIP